MAPMAIEVRRAADHAVTRAEGRTTVHSFSFGAHYDPRNLGFGPLFALNDERLPPGTGYDDHRHARVVLLTWVLGGVLRHRDDRGVERLLPAGSVQVQSAGEGIVHAETSADDHHETRFLQSWLHPDRPDAAATYAVTSMAEFAPVPLTVGVTNAQCCLGNLDPNSAITLMPAARTLALVATGEVTAGRFTLHEGDEARLTEEPGTTLTAGPDGAALLLWRF